MARIPKRLYHGPVDSTVETVYTVPAVTKTVIRHIHVTNPTGSAATITLSIGVDAAGTRIFDAYELAAGSVMDHFAYYVLEATEVIQADSSVDDLLILTIDGDELILG